MEFLCELRDSDSVDYAFCVSSDDDFRDLVDRVPGGCRITIVSDSCHSGGLIDEAKEQIGESMKGNQEEEHGSGGGFLTFLQKRVEDAVESHGFRIPSGMGFGSQDKGEHEDLGGSLKGQGYMKNKALPLPTLIEILQQRTGKKDVDVGNLRPTLFDVFGDDASPKVKKFMNVIFTKLQDQGQGQGKGADAGGGFMGMVGGMAMQFLQQKMEETNGSYAKPAMETQVGSKREIYAGAASRSLPDSGILISGCQTDQTSADANPPGDASQAYGALSNAIQMIIAETNGRVSNRDLVLNAREILKRQGYTQRPGLYCCDKHVHDPFIC
ncbi:UNVERIFIED_CONTAM: Metacaspase-4 [Sesamum latifolium]|uniref:Metacaspase-4 n=1 Tax=Sesamum latifolium TaxID=2727402 RepID=A0AAW2TQF9_9LAMI